MQKQESLRRVGNNDWASCRFSLSQIIWRYVRLNLKAAHCASRVGSSLACIHSDAGVFGGVLQMQVDPRASGSSAACMYVHFASSDALSVQGGLSCCRWRPESDVEYQTACRKADERAGTPANGDIVEDELG